MGFNQTDYQKLHVSFADQYAAGIRRYLPKRAFWKNDNWANPDQIPPQSAGLTGTPKRLPIPPIQRAAITAIRDSLAPSATARSLLATADQGRVTAGFEFDPESTSGATYTSQHREVFFNAGGWLTRFDTVDQFMPWAGYFAAHELGHVAQHRQSGPDYGRWSLRYRLMHQIMATRHYEAAADAVAVDVAWQLKDAGKPEMWQVLHGDPHDAHLAQAYARSIAKNPDNAVNGKARRAVHDAWFKDPLAVLHYDQVVLDNTRTVLDVLVAQQIADFPDKQAGQLAGEAGRFRVTKEQIRDYAVMPDGVDHLRLKDHADVWDDRYTQPSSPSMLRQAELMHDMMQRLAAGQILMEGDFDALDKAKGIISPKTNVVAWRARRQGRGPSPAPSPDS
ncbi:MAG: DUF6782 family putative metallopeptidase [Pseudomonadota bacterium]